MSLRSRIPADFRSAPERAVRSGYPSHDEVVAHAAHAIQGGSSSFAAAARLFDEDTRESTLMLYAWCRHCDDVIDGQSLGRDDEEGGAAARAAGIARLTELEAETRRACAGDPSDDPVFVGLAEVVQRHQVEAELPLEHLAGFRMDVEQVHYQSLADTLLYCYRVAGVVGLMMARVMGAWDRATLDRACDLGIAFQLTNIARDIVPDAEIGRIYLPADWLLAAGIPSSEIAKARHRDALAALAGRLVETAEPYYSSAVSGIADLPLRAAWSVATARDVYRAIGRHVKAKGSHAWDSRVTTSRFEKLWFAARGAGVALAARAVPKTQRAHFLYKRPG
ncbi:15-cis-phytoene synthase [Burkholderiales bacterium 8X]|nr:15-cis-phytoene synthase [Burkholderiales bacterium 8X]